MEKNFPTKSSVTLQQGAVVDVDSELEEYHVGLYRMFIAKNALDNNRDTVASLNPQPLAGRALQVQAQATTSTVLRRFFRDMIPIAMGPMALSVLGQVVGGIVPVVEGILEGRVLRVVSIFLFFSDADEYP